MHTINNEETAKTQILMNNAESKVFKNRINCPVKKSVTN
jgi:hypothetical protein